ncbi:hypothetical protein [Frigoribacterium sp. CG_9.8]|uniref:hypothetical protein n=1 Tax=Frigoribacterium sp. CG_9.8 TaxID=2787733 RepID=UPI0018C8ED2E|nr:hypothetical protein [Frigoribacterium sp. CG_9.8]MBG6108824.1 hypothetical protein [Frigoribacterium sp. CG_9.8]
MIENFWANAAYSLIPTLLVGLIFWLMMRAIFRADRTERTVYAAIEVEERARFAAEQTAAEQTAAEQTVAERTVAERTVAERTAAE